MERIKCSAPSRFLFSKTCLWVYIGFKRAFGTNPLPLLLVMTKASGEANLLCLLLSADVDFDEYMC